MEHEDIIRSSSGERVGELTSFLSDTVLSWTINDINNDSLNKSKVNKVPQIFKSAEEFQDIHRQYLVEETRAMLRSGWETIAKPKIFHISSAQECGTCCYYVDISLEKSMEYGCNHISNDNDIFLLSCASPLEKDFNMSFSCLGMAIKVGRDTFHQKSFSVLLSKNHITEIQPKELRFATFLANLTVKMKISQVLSFTDKKNIPAIKAIMEFEKTINNKCKSCDKRSKYKTDTQTVESVVSSVNCVHKIRTELVCTPPGTRKHSLIADIVKLLVARKLKTLICFPSITQVSEFLTQLDDYSNVLVLNDIYNPENQTTLHKASLGHKSQELYCCLAMWKAWMSEMASLLGLGAYYHVRCRRPENCTRCKKTGLLQFSLMSFMKRFHNLYPLLQDILDYIIKKIPKVCINLSDLERVTNLLDTMGHFEDLIHSDSLTDSIVQKAFGLIAESDLTAEDNEYDTGHKLNETREACIRLLNSLCSSLTLPKPRSRSEIEIFCIKHSLVLISTPDCASQLHGIQMEPFHAFIVGDASLINENELLIPLVLPLRHTIFLGDHKHLQPFVQSKIWAEAGFGASLFQRLQALSPKMHMLREQQKMHSLLAQFPNKQFYGDELVDGEDINDAYNEEFTQLERPYYAFFNIRSVDKRRHNGKITIQTAAIVMLVEMLYRGPMIARRRLNVGVICLSSNEANIVRSQLRYDDEMHAKVNLDVKSLDSLEQEWFDVIIISINGKDSVELDFVKDNCINAALTCARHLCWLVGESDVLLRCRGSWRDLVNNARNRKCLIDCKGKTLAGIAQKLEVNMNMKKKDSIASNSSLPNNVVCKPAQETTWAQRPHRGKFILSHVRDQRGQADTCSLQCCAGVTESGKKYQCACQEPPQDFKCILSIGDFKIQYAKNLKLSDGFGSEKSDQRGIDRIVTGFDTLKHPGVMCCNISESQANVPVEEQCCSGQRVKISGYTRMIPEDMDATSLTSLLNDGKIMAGHFRLSRNYFYLKPGEVYRYDETIPYIHPESNLPVSHAVMIIGSGHGQTESETEDHLTESETEEKELLHHMAMQNSEGEIFGFNGTGRVDKESIRGLYMLNP